jgi:hypothetical protein
LKDKKILDFRLDQEFQWLEKDMEIVLPKIQKISTFEPLPFPLEKAKADTGVSAKSVVRGRPDSNR